LLNGKNKNFAKLCVSDKYRNNAILRNKKYMTIRILLGDQLNRKHSWFLDENQEQFLYVFMETKTETSYVKHHKKKVIGFFLAMREFAKELQDKNLNVLYYKITDTANKHNFTDNIIQLVEQYNAKEIQYQFPDEYRLYNEFKELKNKISVPVKSFESEHFYCTMKEIATYGNEKKYYLMETFYRMMRKKSNVLLEGEKPFGGKWNYDTDNRKKWKKEFEVPNQKNFDNELNQVLEDIEIAKIETFGTFNKKNFDLPLNRKQAYQQLHYFLEHLYGNFGNYQDAMHTEETMLFHSNLSFALNTKIISPAEVIKDAETYFYQNQNKVSLSQAEGFIRQILGWREYIRMVYWNKFEEQKNGNFFNFSKKLPEVFWTGKSKMKCVSECAKNSLDNAYAHHIQRLMVLGNFALLMETAPQEVDAWYLGVYIDAIEWVQLPNTHGMSQFADGGIVATKPYISSANYIDKMSNYCENCSYDKKTKTEENSCPMNSLYWNFLEKNREKLKDNIRMKMMYALLNKIQPEELEKIIIKAESFIEKRDF
jgi:deoxyribodipyrimidine photolyase-related protein